MVPLACASVSLNKRSLAIGVYIASLISLSCKYAFAHWRQAWGAELPLESKAEG